MWERLPEGIRSVLLLLGLAGSIACYYQFRDHYRPEAAPPDIIALQTAGTAQRAEYVIETYRGVLMGAGPGSTWRPFNPGIQGGGKIRATENTKFDYLFIPCYVLALGLGCAWTAHEFRKLKQDGPARLADRVALLQPLAGLLDAVENVGLLNMLAGRLGSWPAITAVLASIKIGLVVAGGAVFVAGIVLAAGKLFRRDLPETPRPRLAAAYLIVLAIAYATVTAYAFFGVKSVEPLPMPPEPRAVSTMGQPEWTGAPQRAG
jgi:hypothetical protein